MLAVLLLPSCRGEESVRPPVLEFEGKNGVAAALDAAEGNTCAGTGSVTFRDASGTEIGEKSYWTFQAVMLEVMQRVYNWIAIPNGWLLKGQTSTILDPNGTVIAKAIVTMAYNGVIPTGGDAAPVPAQIAQRIKSVLYQLQLAAFGIVLPAPLQAQYSCGSGAVKSVGGLALLILAAPGVVTGAGAVGWLIGWAIWTAQLTDSAVACSGGGGGGGGGKALRKT